jgi:hypothetical protein
MQGDFREQFAKGVNVREALVFGVPVNMLRSAVRAFRLFPNVPELCNLISPSPSLGGLSFP